MQVFTHIAPWRAWRASAGYLVFVPTMGCLHEGHLALCQRALACARPRGGVVAASIFVNPIQFAAGEDFDAYPRSFEADCQKLRDAGVDAVFHPAPAEMYPDGPQAFMVQPPQALQEMHCGATRPGHFQGVATVLSKLFGIVQPQCAVFGMKDYQQLAVVRAMVRSLDMDVAIEGVPTCRAPDGLALSSRNAYLTPAQRAQAPQLYAALLELAAQVRAGRRDYAALEQQASAQLAAQGWQPQYVHVCAQATLLPPVGEQKALVVLAAAYLGSTRLIDNVEIAL